MQDLTPGPVGYLIAVAVSFTVFAAFVAAGAPPAEGAGQDSFLNAWLIIMIYGEWFAEAFGLVGVVLVHLACRRVRFQAVHVAAAAVAGLLPLLTFVALGAGWNALWAAWVPVATAIGRWSVVPLVPAVRLRRQALSPGARATS